jgi:hypothetical protein
MGGSGSVIHPPTKSTTSQWLSSKQSTTELAVDLREELAAQ